MPEIILMLAVAVSRLWGPDGIFGWGGGGEQPPADS